MASAQEQQSWASGAALNALLRYAPQKAALQELQKAAVERFQESVQAGKTEGVLGQEAAQAAVAPTQAIYSQAAKSGEAGRNLVAPILAALSPDSPFRAAAATEQAAGTERLAQSQATALSNLQQRSVAASELPAYSQSAAASKLASELQKLTAKGELLRGSEAADQAAEVGKQRSESNKLAEAERANIRTTGASESNSKRSTATSEANNQRSTGTSRANNQETNATRRATTGASKPLSQATLDKAGATIAEIRHYAGEGGNNRAERVAALTEGRPEQSAKNAKGEPVKVPKIPPFKPDVLMSAALDWAEYGHVTRATENRLGAAGYDPSKLGIPRAPAEPRTGSAGVGAIGQRAWGALPRL